MKKVKLLCMALLMVLILTGCLPNDGYHSKENLAGFWWGIWHGMIALISLIISIFRHSIGIYEVNNTGFWYNAGYYLGLACIAGSTHYKKTK